MDPFQVRALHNCQRDFMRDIDVDRPFLLSMYIDGLITEEQKTEILEEKTRRARCAKLLEVMPRRGPSCFPKFVAKIRRDYSWIAEKLEKELVREKRNLPKGINDKLTEVINQHLCPLVYGSERHIITPGSNHPAETVGRLSELVLSLKHRSLRALEISTTDDSINEESLPALIALKIQSLYDEVNEMKTNLKTERKKVQEVKLSSDQKVSKEMSKLKKELEKHKESHKKIESELKIKNKTINKLQHANLKLEKGNLDLKARLDVVRKKEKLKAIANTQSTQSLQSPQRYSSASTQLSIKSGATISELFQYAEPQ